MVARAGWLPQYRLERPSLPDILQRLVTATANIAVAFAYPIVACRGQQRRTTTTAVTMSRLASSRYTGDLVVAPGTGLGEAEPAHHGPPLPTVGPDAALPMQYVGDIVRDLVSDGLLDMQREVDREYPRVEAIPQAAGTGTELSRRQAFQVKVDGQAVQRLVEQFFRQGGDGVQAINYSPAFALTDRGDAIRWQFMF